MPQSQHVVEFEAVFKKSLCFLFHQYVLFTYQSSDSAHIQNLSGSQVPHPWPIGYDQGRIKGGGGIVP